LKVLYIHTDEGFTPKEWKEETFERASEAVSGEQSDLAYSRQMSMR